MITRVPFLRGDPLCSYASQTFDEKVVTYCLNRSCFQKSESQDLNKTTVHGLLEQLRSVKRLLNALDWRLYGLNNESSKGFNFKDTKPRLREKQHRQPTGSEVINKFLLGIITRTKVTWTNMLNSRMRLKELFPKTLAIPSIGKELKGK